MKPEKPQIPESIQTVNDMEKMIPIAARDEVDVLNICFENTFLNRCDIGAIEFRGCRFQNCRFADCRLDGAFFCDVTFSDCDLSNLVFSGCSFRRVEFCRCKIVGTLFPDSYLEHVLFQGCTGKWASLTGSKWKKVLLEDCDFSEGNFEECSFVSVEIVECNLEKAVFLHTPLRQIDLTSDEIGGIVLSGPELRGAIVTALQASDLARYLGLVIR